MCGAAKRHERYGEVVERLKAPASKAGVPDEGTVSSNLTLSAITEKPSFALGFFTCPGIRAATGESRSMTAIAQLST